MRQYTLFFVFSICFLGMIILACVPYSYLGSDLGGNTIFASLSDDEGVDEDDSSDSEADDDGEADDELLLPYQFVADTVALMTCDHDNRETFNFFAGALGRSSGVKLVDRDAKDNLTDYTYYKTAPSMFFTPDPIGNRTNFQKGFGNLSSIHFEKSNLSHRSFVNEIDGNPLTLKHSDSDFIARLNQNKILFAFQKSSKNQPVYFRNEDNDLQAFGNYLTLSLEEEQDRKFLSDIKEKYFYEGDEGSAEWDCSLKLKIRRHRAHTEGSEKRCVHDDKSGDKEYDLVREIVGSGWDINIRDKCVSLSSSRDFCYNLTTESRFRSLLVKDDCEGLSYTEQCPHLLSICERR